MFATSLTDTVRSPTNQDFESFTSLVDGPTRLTWWTILGGWFANAITKCVQRKSPEPLDKCLVFGRRFKLVDAICRGH